MHARPPIEPAVLGQIEQVSAESIAEKHGDLTPEIRSLSADRAVLALAIILPLLLIALTAISVVYTIKHQRAKKAARQKESSKKEVELELKNIENPPVMIIAVSDSICNDHKEIA